MKPIRLIIAASAFALTSCANLTPEERALLLRSAERAIDIGLDRLDPPKPVKAANQK